MALVSTLEEGPDSPMDHGRVAKVLIVDDHPAVREGLAARIAHQPDLEVCGEAEDIDQALAMMDATGADVVVIDISLKTGSGIDLIRRIKARHPGARLLVCSMYPDSLYAERALRAGAQGYINKENTTGRIVEAIRSVRDGQAYVSDEIAERLEALAVPPDEAPLARLLPAQVLSDRELDVFQRIGDGQTTAEIAHQLELSVHTIETYRRRIKVKLRLHTAAQLSRAAAEWALEGRQG